jgi:hypothetical protein
MPVQNAKIDGSAEALDAERAHGTAELIVRKTREAAFVGGLFFQFYFPFLPARHRRHKSATRSLRTAPDRPCWANDGRLSDQKQPHREGIPRCAPFDKAKPL